MSTFWYDFESKWKNKVYLTKALFACIIQGLNYDKLEATLYKAIDTIHVSTNCIKYSVELKFY